MQIPFHKPYITEEEIAEVVDSLRSGWTTMGPKTIRFEEEFGRYVGARAPVAVSSCTAAMHLALKAVGIEEGDEVIVPAVTFTATGEVVCCFGAKPGCLLRNSSDIRLKRITLAPPFARALASLSVILCQILEKLPFLCTHYLGIIRKK